MSVDPFYYPPSTGSGYTCAVCGGWVPYNTVHNCPGYSAQNPPSVKWDRMSDVRIADALERIAEALETLSAVQSGRPA